MRTHPPTLLTLVKRELAGMALHADARVLVAVSGGPDSMALLHAMSRQRRLRIVAHGVDHGLRAAAAGELDMAAGLADRLGVHYGRTRVVVAEGRNLQARAREARYEALRAAAASANAQYIATAHHAEDRAETVIIRLLRGAGVRGLGVLPPIAGDLVRPMIRATRADVLAHISRHQIPHVFDPSNEEVRFVRVRVRMVIVPLLEAMDPKIVEHLCRIADEVASGSGSGARSGSGFRLGRAVEEALVGLARSGDRRGRVSLPGGLVAMVDESHGRPRHGTCKD